MRQDRPADVQFESQGPAKGLKTCKKMLSWSFLTPLIVAFVQQHLNRARFAMVLLTDGVIQRSPW